MNIPINSSRHTLPTPTLFASLLLACLGCRAPGFSAVPFWPQARTTPPVEQCPYSQTSAPSNTSVGLATAERSNAEPVDFQIDQPQNFELIRASATKDAANVPPSAYDSTPTGLPASVQFSEDFPPNTVKRNCDPQDTHSEVSADSNLVSANAASIPLADSTATSPTIPLRITGVRTNLGPVRVAVFTNPNTFPTPSSAAWTNVTQSTNSTVTVACPQTGRLAVAAYQDLNNDGELNRNRFGIPLEPFAFSNGATGDRGPPTFSAAAVDAATGQTPIHLSLP